MITLEDVKEYRKRITPYTTTAHARKIVKELMAKFKIHEHEAWCVVRGDFDQIIEILEKHGG